MRKQSCGVAMLAMLTFASAVSADQLTTTYANNNSENGIMFDVVAKTAIVVTGWAINEDAGTNSMQIYGKSGTHVGFEANPAAWTLLGSANATSAGLGAGTPIPISLNVPIAAGASYAFYITNTNGAVRVGYTNGTGVGTIDAQDNNAEILEGTGKAYPFAASFIPRIPNVTMTYFQSVVSAVPTLSEMAKAILIVLMLAVGGWMASRRYRR